VSSRCIKPIWVTGSSTPHPCGGCIGCKTRKVNEWKARCVHEAHYWPRSSFVTLTYASEHLPEGKKILCLPDLQKFYKRLRKRLASENPPRTIKHFSCGEYGDPSKGGRHQGDRPHYHAIIFGVGPLEKQLIEETWGMGNVKLKPFNEATAAYTAGYVYKKFSKEFHYEINGDIPRPFQVQSRGLGAKFAEEEMERFYDDGYMTLKGVKYSLPRYYRRIVGVNEKQREEFILEQQIKQIEEYGKRELDYFSKEAIALRRRSRKQTELNILAKMKLDERLKEASKKHGA